MSSPTSRTLEMLRKEGWTAQVVEKWNPHSKTRLDLFGGIDVLACRPTGIETKWEGWTNVDLSAQILGVQATSDAHHAERKAKLLSEKRMAIWLASGGRLEIWSWSKRGARGKRKTWTARREPLMLSDFVPQVKEPGQNVPRETSQQEVP